MAYQPVTTHEPYRPPPPISHERINPFDKNTTPSYNAKTTGIYSSLSSNVTSTTKPSSPPVTAKEEKTLDDLTKDRFNRQQGLNDPQSDRCSVPQESPKVASTISSVSDFDYSYKPPPLSMPPAFTSHNAADTADSTHSVDKVDVPKSSEAISSDFKRPPMERKLSDADIIFGNTKPIEAYSSSKYGGYGRNRSNSSFTSTSTDSNYIYGSRDSKVRDNSFQKSLSVSSDKDGDFSNDPIVMATRAYQGIQNDAFSDYDSPNIPPATKPWSNIDDDYDLK